MSARHPDQFDLFLEPVFPVRTAASRIDPARFRAVLSKAMARAVRECAWDRAEIAARMAQYLGVPSFSKATLNAYTAESRNGHDITMPRFKAFVFATNAAWLWDVVAADQGITMLEGDEARFAEIARLQQERRALGLKLKELTSVPVNSKRRAQS